MIEIASYGPWAVVTGASSGIGRAFARNFAAAGLNVVLASRSTDKLEALGKELDRVHGVSYRAVEVDLSRPGAAATIVEATADLDVGLLVSNAGTGRPGSLLEQPLEHLHRRLALNATSHLELVHAFGQRFSRRGRSGVIFVSALGAGHGIPNMAHDAASKAYVLSLGGALHYELAKSDIGVTVMLPGNVETPIIDTLGIERTDLPVRPYPVGKAVRGTVNAFLKGQAVYIPNGMMRMIGRLMPRGLSSRVNGKMLGKAAQNLSEQERLAV
ncbi:SDR family NAD(P)-dependent oxidoreductase [Glycomyces halotolerans]